MSSNACKSVGIVGAGIQGVCIGLQLLKKNIQNIESYDRSNFVEEEDPIKAPFLGTRVLDDKDIDFNKKNFNGTYRC